MLHARSSEVWTQGGRRTLSMGLLGLLIGCLGSCAGSQPEQRAGSGKIPKEALDPSLVAESATALPGSSGRCQGGICTCRPTNDYGAGQADTDVEDPPPPQGKKRFELRTGRGGDTMKITVEGVGTFVKTGSDPAPGCVYVDLPPGAHRVRYHVIARDPAQGVEPVLLVGEYSPVFRRWYRTFAFRCAQSSGPCTHADARDAVAQLGRVRQGKHDPCGSTLVQGLRFQSERAADAALADFDLQFVLNAYRFEPRFPPGASKCTGPSYKAEDPEQAP